MKEKQIEINGIKYLLNEDGTACVTGVNKDFWEKEKVECLTIPKEVECEGARYSVTKIEVRAFDEYDSWTVISIPESVTEIKHWAFAGCYNLQSIEVTPENKMYSSFEGMLYNKEGDVLIACPTGKTSVSIPEGIVEIGEDAFFACRNLTSVVIPDSVTEIGEGAFRWCKHLQSIEVSPENKVYSSFDGMLYNKEGDVLIECMIRKTSVNIPERVTEIRDCAFRSCRGLSSVVIPKNVTKIGDRVFVGCWNLQSIEVSSENKVYSSFDGMLYNKEGDVLIECMIRKTSVNIPERVTEIRDYAFRSCRGLSSVVIPASVTKIGNDSFRGCDNLQSIEVSSENQVYSSFDGVLYSKDRDALIACPAGKTSVNIPEGVTEIRDCAFRSCRDLSSISIPESVTEIGNRAFGFCRGLTSIVIPGSVTKIGNRAFGFCRGLTSIVCLAKEPPAFGLFQGSICGTLRVPAGCCEAYQQSKWGKCFERIEEIENEL